MDVDARVEALEAENERLRDELDRLRDERGLSFMAPLEFGLTGKETLMLGRLLKGGVVTKDQLLDALYTATQEEAEIKIVDVFICKLRKKLRPFGIGILTRWGTGYQMTGEMIAVFQQRWARAA